MGFLHECPSCHKVCEQNICTRTDAKGYETELLECSGCKHTWFATHVITEVNPDITTCPKCGSEELWVEDGPEFAHGSSDEVALVWQCESCGARWAACYDLKLRTIDMLRNRNGSES